jgi:hypothetical protein
VNFSSAHQPLKDNSKIPCPLSRLAGFSVALFVLCLSIRAGAATRAYEEFVCTAGGSLTNASAQGSGGSVIVGFPAGMTAHAQHGAFVLIEQNVHDFQDLAGIFL